MKTNKAIPLRLALVMLVSGCASTESVSPQPAPSVPRPAETAIPSPAAIPLPTPAESVEALITSTPSATAPVALAEIPIPSCTDGSASPDDGLRIDGTIVVEGPAGLNLLGGEGLSSHTLKVPSIERYAAVGFSPSGQWLALIETKQRQDSEPLEPRSLLLLSASGEMIAHSLDLSGFAAAPGLFVSGLFPANAWHWVNEEVLYAPIETQTLPIGSQDVLPLPQLYEPGKKVWRDDLIAEIPAFQAWNMAGFSPDLTRVLYEHPPSVDSNTALVLWDLIEGKPIWSDEKLSISRGAIITFSPDSSMAAYTSYHRGPDDDHEVYLVGRDGGERQPITSRTYPGKDMAYSELSWSHDNRYLALNGRSSDISVGRDTILFVFDRLSGKYISQCPYQSSRTSRLLWSPGDLYVAFGSDAVGLLDWQANKAFELPVPGKPLSWSAVFQPTWP